MGWFELDGGSAIGECGNEGGIIIRDEELDSSAVITLEKLSAGHYAVTCGIYGTMVHTAWFDEPDALLKYEQMKSDIKDILEQEDNDGFYRLIEEFTERY